MPKRGNSSSAAPTKRTKGSGDEHSCVYVCRWARVTDVDSLDHEKIQEVEWSGGDLSEIHSCIKEELESVLNVEDTVAGTTKKREQSKFKE